MVGVTAKPLVPDCTIRPYQLCTCWLARSAVVRYWPVPKNTHILPVFGSLPASMPAVIGCTVPLASLAMNKFTPGLLGVAVAAVPALVLRTNDHTLPLASPA